MDDELEKFLGNITVMRNVCRKYMSEEQIRK